jgi:hypothetical protein
MRDEVEESALPIFAALDACSDDEIERLLLPAIFACVCGRLGDGRAKRTFSKLGADTHTIELRAKELVIDYFFWGQRNKEAFLRKRVERNKNLPRSEQRGPGGTSIPTLRSYLHEALKKYDDMPICASLKKAGPDHAEEMFRSVMDRARQYFKEKS